MRNDFYEAVRALAGMIAAALLCYAAYIVFEMMPYQPSAACDIAELEMQELMAKTAE